MAVSGFTWYQGEANECPNNLPLRYGTPCGGEYYACQLRALITSWRSHFVNTPVDAPFLVNELGGIQDPQWAVMRQSFHQATQGLPNTAVIANSDMADTSGRVDKGLPSGAMHSKRKVNLGFRNGVAMLKLLGGSVEALGLASASGPVLQSAAIEKQSSSSSSSSRSTNTSTSTGTTAISGNAAVDISYKVTMTFDAQTADNLHFAGAACCIICCQSQNGSAVQLRVENSSDPTGYTWHRSEVPVVTGE